VFTFLTTLIAVGGITLGVAALIITLAVMSGFHRDIRERILGLQPHLTVLKESGTSFHEHEQVAADILREKEIRAASPFVYGQIILRHGEATAGVVLKGIDWKKEQQLVGLAKSIKDTRLLAGGLQDNQVIIGKELARNLGAALGKEVILVSPGQFGVVPRMEKFRVAGIFSSGMYEYDANLAYVSLPSGQKLFGLENAVSGVGVALTDWEKADTIAAALQAKLDYPYWVRSWETMNKNLFAALKLEKIMMFIILTLIIVVAAFNIISNLLLLTVEKAKEIGILSALGFRRLEIGRIFLFEGLIIGMTGIFAGTGLGVGLSLLLKKYQFIHLPADVYYLDTLPVRLVPGDIISVVAATLLISLVAGIYPAYQATKLDPLEAIRYG